MNTTITTQHSTRDVCPRCEITFLDHVHCANQNCSFHIAVCATCDATKGEAVTAFMKDHAKDCACAPPRMHAKRVQPSLYMAVRAA